jgi:hypothetical protein
VCDFITGTRARGFRLVRIMALEIVALDGIIGRGRRSFVWTGESLALISF